MFAEDFENKTKEASLEDANYSLAIGIGRPDWNLPKSTETRLISPGTKYVWITETNTNLYQSDGKANVWRKKGSAQDPKHTIL